MGSCLSVEESSEVAVRVVVQYRGTDMMVNVCKTEEQLERITVWQLKEKIQSRYRYPAREQRLFFADQQEERDFLFDQELQNVRLLSDCGINNGSRLILKREIRKSKGRSRPRWCGTDAKMGDNLSMDIRFGL